mmetsp:Transcript_16750/g.24766  ORF Transcript_16750/g.24766 Transcript_16750/m.24766 type:complete len:114 (-) Transcript_16750:326-667(-)
MKPDEKGVVFSQISIHLDLIGKVLADAGHSFVRIAGSVLSERRTACIHAFNAETNSLRLILCSLHAAGTGINLTRGNHCFMMDCCWNAAVGIRRWTAFTALDRSERSTVYGLS